MPEWDPDDHPARAWHVEYPDGGYERPRWECMNEDEVRLVFSKGGQRRFACGYCHQRFQTKSVEKAVSWYHKHDCRTWEAAEAAALVVSLTQLAADEGRLAA